MELFISYDNKKCKNCKYLKIRKKFFSKEDAYKCSIQLMGEITNMNLVYCKLYKPKELTIDEI